MPWLLVRLINLVKHATVGEMLLLCLLPIAGDFRQGEQLYFGELVGILPGDSLGSRPVIMLRGNLLAFRTVEILQISLCNRARASLVHDLVNDADGRLAENAH